MNNQNDDFIIDVFSDLYEDTEKPFNQVFKLDNSFQEPKLKPLIKSQIDPFAFDPEDLIICPSVYLEGKLIHELADKILIGKTHKFSGVFYITSYKDS
jgi:hypothetical protein